MMARGGRGRWADYGGGYAPAAGSGSVLEELAFADFVNGVYRIGGATIPVTGMFTEDVDNWGTFNPATHITAAGLVGNTQPIGTSALTAVLLPAGCTIIGAFESSAVGTSTSTVGLDLVDFPDFTYEVFVRLRLNNGGVADPTLAKAIATPVSRPMEAQGAQLRRFAVTLAPDRATLSIDGGAILTDTTATVPAFNTFGMTVYVANLKHIKFHPPQPDASLPGLSS